MDLIYGIEVVVNNDVLDTAPSCSHGPTLLFKRSGKHGNREFYACSACRNRKDCNFFQWANDRKVPSISMDRLDYKGGYNDNSKLQSFSAEEAFERFKKFHLLPPKKRQICKLCSQLLLPDDNSAHVGHKILSCITDSQLQEPTFLLNPLENGKKEAQFFFSKRTTSFIISTLQHLGIQSVLCIGCPRLHENICKEDTSMCSLLLDIDARLQQFYPPAKFCHYNMFNHYFFNGEKSKAVYYEFLRNASFDRLIVLMDPPFGGLVEPLAYSLKRIQADYYEQLPVGETESRARKDVQVIWIFPYFMEKKIIATSPAFVMLDYEVDYDNHPLYKCKDSGGRRVSPIRIFTNIEAKRIPLPNNEGYRFCEDCQRYVAKENQHCVICKCCPSKDGRPYNHCSLCGYCVKATYIHCTTCGSCQNSQHSCAELDLPGCHTCGSMSHKRRHCPKSHQNRYRKRPRSTKSSFQQKKSPSMGQK